MLSFRTPKLEFQVDQPERPIERRVEAGRGMAIFDY
jgi:hypothetical protein